MNAKLPLQKLYQWQSLRWSTATPLDKLVCSYIDKAGCDNVLVDFAISELQEGDSCTPWDQAEKWRLLLSFALFSKLTSQDSCQKLLAETCLSLMKKPFWEEFQLESALRSLCAFLLNLPYKFLAPQQSSKGAATLEYGCHWPWAQIPHSLFQAETGVLWHIFGRLSQDKNYVQASYKVSEWQLNTLDQHGIPFKGLYVQEQNASMGELLLFDYLLFCCNGWDSIAKKLLSELEKIVEKGFHIPVYAVLLEAWMDSHKSSQPKPLPVTIADPDLSLVGIRRQEYSLALTLCGGGTGMGALHREDVQIVSYGPQYLPLGDCQGFGIENSRSSHMTMTSTEEKIELQGMVRLVSKQGSQAGTALFGCGAHSGLWMDVSQHFSGRKLTIETMVLGLDSPDLAFVFFVNASL